MTIIDTEAFKKAGLTDEEVESVKIGIEDVENGRIYTENEFYSIVEKSLFSKIKENV